MLPIDVSTKKLSLMFVIVSVPVPFTNALTMMNGSPVASITLLVISLYC